MTDIENIRPQAHNKKRSIEQIYQKKTQLEHILLRPDTYVGSVERETDYTWVYDSESNRMVHRNITYVPGLYKIFDEILVNAADNRQRDSSMDTLKVDIDEETGAIKVWNNGRGIPITMHEEHKCYVPELIFGHLLTSSNYDDQQKKTTGGRNGYGAKLTNIFSKEFVLETGDASRAKKYRQTWRNNMSERSKPTIKTGSRDYTCVTFTPDFDKFKMLGLEEDIVALMKKRVYDIAGTTPANLKVYLNGKRLAVKSFKTYCDMYLPADAPRMFETVNDRWQVCVTASDGHFQNVSFVNNISTAKGGTHVKYVADQVADSLLAHVKKKNKGLALKSLHVKNHLWVFVNCLIENPAFGSQTKVALTTRHKDFGSECKLSDKYLKSVATSGVLQAVLDWAKFKASKDLKKTDGKKQARVSGITKLEDANMAGSRQAHKCTLILTEGDSAKALAMSGLSVVGRDYYGVFPLKGKLLNVRDATVKQINSNDEISNLKKILGLKHGVEYEDAKALRYGHVMIMTDQDHDGSHIKGLVINFFQSFWPSLLRLPGFLVEFITPIVKCTKGKKQEVFFTIPEYENWKAATNDGKGWRIKYYKGLGTSTSMEAKEYFTALEEHQIDFEWRSEVDDQLITMAFSKKGADARKQWIKEFVPGTFLDMAVSHVSYSEFVNKELVLYSMASNERAIPSAIDGLKPGQRKILYTCMLKKIFKEIKVATLSGYVTQLAAYHHGEQSLHQTVVVMAQNYPGSNNINLLFPSGQFGTRHMGGKDAASARYIFTFTSPIARAVFPECDDRVLEYLDDDGKQIEPKFFVPVLPMVLVNGAAGIGTGWSSNVPNYNPRDIVANIRRHLSGQEMEAMHPWYKGFKGEFILGRKGTYKVRGVIEKLNDTTLKITELPISKWTHDYKLFLEGLLSQEKITDFKEYHTDQDVEFEVKLSAEQMVAVEAAGLHKAFKLEGSCATSNMVLFTKEGRLKRYDTPLNILEDFCSLRIDCYGRRKAFMTETLTSEVSMLENKMRFIQAVISGEMEIRRVKKAVLVQKLAAAGYVAFPPTKKKKDELDNAEEEEEEQDAGASDYNYLLKMPLWSLTFEKVEELQRQVDDKIAELDELKAVTLEEMWRRDLDRFLEALDEHEELEKAANQKDLAALKRKRARKKKSARSTSRRDDDDEDWAEEKKRPRKRAAPAKKTGVPAKSNAPVNALRAVMPVKNKAVPKKSAPVVLSDSEDEFAPMDTDEPETKAPPRAKRSRAKSKSYAEISEDEEEASEFEASESEDEYQSEGSESDEAGSASDYEPTPKKPAKRAAPKAKPVPKSKAAQAPAKSAPVKKAPAKKAPAKKAPAKKAPAKKAPAKKAPVRRLKKVVLSDSDSDVEDDEPTKPLSLAERVSLRMSKSKPAAKKKTRSPTYVSSQDEEEEEEEDDVSAFSPSPSPKPVKATKGRRGQKRTLSVQKDDEADSPVAAPSKVTPKPKRQRSRQLGPKAGKSKITKPSFNFSDEEEEEEEKVPAVTPMVKKRGRRATKSVSYKESSGEEESEEEEEAEEMSCDDGGLLSDSGSEFDEPEEGDDSDYME